MCDVIDIPDKEIQIFEHKQVAEIPDQTERQIELFMPVVFADPKPDQPVYDNRAEDQPEICRRFDRAVGIKHDAEKEQNQIFRLFSGQHIDDEAEGQEPEQKCKAAENHIKSPIFFYSLKSRSILI